MAEHHPIRHNWRFKDITGTRFGRLKVIEYTGKNSDNHALWRCCCDCGETVTVMGKLLRTGHTQSCGCYQRKRASEAQTTHGLRMTSTAYKRWMSMRARCRTKNEPNRRNYAARGITVCARWDSFVKFLSDMGEPPTDKHTLERMDNNGIYEPGNCRWATAAEQSRNTRRNHLLTFNGETKILADWAAEKKMPYGVLQHRISLGWNVERALTQPLRKSPTKSTCTGPLPK